MNSLSTLGLVTTLCVPLGAQIQPDAANALTPSVGIEQNAHGLRGLGPNYEVQFGVAGLQFYPTLGTATETPHKLSLQLASIGREDGGYAAATPGERRVDGTEVRYVRSDYDEVYDLRVEGMEQSFVFRSLPSGSGDLVVRIEVETSLDPKVDGAGMRFELPGHGAATLGGVTGIAADGATSAGSMRYDDGVLELVLPEHFVDNAALPLVLDPLIGSNVPVSSSGFDYNQADIAYDVSSNTYLVVFEREVGTLRQIRGRRLSSTGQPLGSVFAINTSDTSKYAPSVANINARNAFVVSWDEGGNIRATGVTTAGIVLNTTGITVAGGSNLRYGNDLGGDSTNGENVICVWSDYTQRQIQARKIRISSTSFVALPGPVHVIESDDQWGLNTPSISKSGGDIGRYFVAWTELDGKNEIYGRAIDSEMTPIGSTLRFTNDNYFQQNPSVDGNGTHWVVAWEQSELTTTSPKDIVARSVEVSTINNAARLASSAVTVHGDSNTDENSPDVAWLGNSALVAFSLQVSLFDRDVLAVSIDPYNCQSCEGTSPIEIGADSAAFPSIGTPFSGGGAGDEAVAVWQSHPASGGDRLIYSRRFVAVDGLIQDLGGRCGAGGTAMVGCARPGQPGFAHRLAGARTNSLALLVLGYERIDLPCGPCTLIPNPFSGFGFSTTTDFDGDASVAMPLPFSSSLEGLVFYDQWLVLSPAAQCAPLGTDLSNALRVQIQ